MLTSVSFNSEINDSVNASTKAGAEHSYVYQETNLSKPEDVAKDGYDALMKGERKVVSGFKNKMQAAMANVMPDSALAGMMKKQMEPTGDGERSGSKHQPSREEREMIQAASNTEGKDLEHRDSDKTDSPRA